MPMYNVTFTNEEYALILEGLDALSSNTREESKYENDRETVRNDFALSKKIKACEKLTNKMNEVQKFG